MSMPKGDGFVVGFAATICVVCSLLLSVAASALKERQDFNVELDRKMNVLKAFGVDVRPGGIAISAEEVERYFTEHISELVIDSTAGKAIEGMKAAEISAEDLSARAKLPLFVWKDDGQVRKYAFPVSGKGLWSTIYGYLALDRDLATIIGVTFYRHGETPGLGGECEKDWFQTNFKEKKVFAGGSRQRFEVVKGKVADRYPSGNDHAVDGISGATITGNGIAKFVNADLDSYELYFKSQRGT